MTITRRRLLQMLGLACGAPLLAFLVWRSRPAATQRSGPFPFLDFEDGALDAFEADYRRHGGRLADRDRWPELVQAQFLLSTDFFRFDADESRVISYVGYYDPAVRPCNNPFSRFE
jgi:hypothetical protein